LFYTARNFKQDVVLVKIKANTVETYRNFTGFSVGRGSVINYDGILKLEEDFWERREYPEPKEMGAFKMMKLTIGKKLISGFIMGAILVGVLSSISYISMDRVENSYSELLNKRVKIMLNVKDIQSNLNLQSDSLRGYLLIEGQKSLDDLNQSNSKITSLINQTRDLVDGQDDINDLQKLADLNRQFKQTADQTVGLYPSDPKKAIGLGTTELTPIIRDMRTITDVIVDRQMKVMSHAAAENNNLVEAVNRLIVGISAGGIVTAIIIGYVVSLIIAKPIVAMKQIAERIAEGDLMTEVKKIKNRDEIGDLAHAFEQMAVNLRNIIQHVGLNADQVARTAEQLKTSADETSKATQQIAHAIEQVASGAETQMTGTEESATAMEEMATGIQRIAENASVVSETSLDTLQNAESGRQSVQQAVAQMNSIAQSVQTSDSTIQLLNVRSHEIEKILEVIKSIADQTNLLALNAAIEAARAGEQGRGFTVVAEEVRKLAEQSAGSANQITELIKEIQTETKRSVDEMNHVKQEVQAGIAITSETEQKFLLIVRSMGQVADQVQEMSATAEQISAGSQQVTASVIHMADISRQTSASSQNVASTVEEQLASMEEISRSAAVLSEMSENLQALIRQFQVNVPG
jgi:methyl-accepting chemotaxis protein